MFTACANIKSLYAKNKIYLRSIHPSVHPSVMYTSYLVESEGAGACRGSHRVRGRVHPVHAVYHSQAHFHTYGKLRCQSLGLQKQRTNTRYHTA